MRGQAGFFDIDQRLRDLLAKGDDLERLKGLVDFEMFRAALRDAVSRSDHGKGGRPLFDHVLMFKVLVLQTMHSLSDERCEVLVKDRLSFMRFLGLDVWSRSLVVRIMCEPGWFVCPCPASGLIGREAA